MGITKYTPEIDAFLREHSKEMSVPEMVPVLQERFGIDVTYNGLRTYYTRNDIHPSPRAGRRGKSKFPDGLEDYIRSIAEGRKKDEILAMVNEHYNGIIDMYQLKAYMNNHDITSGLNCNFHKGHTPWNKGTHFVSGGRSVETRFKKGQMPPTWRPVGSIRINKDGFTEVKVAEPKTWKVKHHLVWEAVHGPVPKNCVITFKDGNKQNFDINNLACITRAQHAMINRMQLWGSGEGFETVLKLADLKLATMKCRQRRKERKRK